MAVRVMYQGVFIFACTYLNEAEAPYRIFSVVRNILKGAYACLLEIRPDGWFRPGWEVPDLASVRRRPFPKRAEGVLSNECLSGAGLIPERTRGFRAIA